ncbi:MAG: phenylalanine--tRNA ligase subunit alpha [Candidatus Peregrinibacteria bacterium]|nr:phenylalanine--tRNA ligase subunit alpha [Candidatus Peregrinibacteria bacterium]
MATPATAAWDDLLKKIKSAPDAPTLDALEQEIFGRKQGLLTLAMKDLGSATPEERTKRGTELNRWKQTFTEAVERRREDFQSASLGSLATEDALDVTLPLPPKRHGHLHLIPEFIRSVEDIFGRMGFEVASGPEIETEENNFNLLNIPADHPARDSQDTFWLTRTGNPKKDMVLRTHTSPVQARYMQAHKPPFRIIYHGKTYRKDADATHSPMFHQFEALMVGKDISLANMKAVMTAAIRELTSKDATFRFRTGFFPFVEPGLEVDMRWQGDAAASREGDWLEIAGCGMVHPNVLTNCGINPKEWQGFAFGFGVERMIMIKHQIPDLRAFYQGDLKFLAQF